MLENKVKMHTLIKLISFVKFQCREFDSREFAASPIVGEILSELLVQFNSSIGNEISFDLKSDAHFTKTIVNSINDRLKHTDEWSEMDKENRKGYIMDLAAPYILEEEMIQSIMSYRNTF